MVIGDRLFSLPIVVEGRDEVLAENNMEVDQDNNNNGAGVSGEKKEQEPRDGGQQEPKDDYTKAAGSQPTQKST